jgi:hypothetical protein
VIKACWLIGSKVDNLIVPFHCCIGEANMEEYMKMFIEISFQQVRITNLGEFVPNAMGGLQRAEEATQSMYMKCVCNQS